ncbi:MAG: hypothetical protein Q8R02_17805 [Hyphomonadaceae bacterium]|nr:hypothetical protein [Hyphomonadaceae bacterium]
MLNGLKIRNKIGGVVLAKVKGRHPEVTDADGVVEIFNETLRIVAGKHVAQRRSAWIWAGANRLNGMATRT